MKTRFRKIAIASAVTAAMAGITVPAQAIVTGTAGEALLVPLVVWDADRNNLNTLIEIEVPASIGWEDVANIYTAPNTTPTNTDLSMGFSQDVFKPVVVGGNTTYVNAIHWFAFNWLSGHERNDSVKVTPDDVIQLNWRDMIGGSFEGVPMYLVLTNEIGYAKSGKADAQFSMFGDAWLVNDVGFEAEIPVLPLADAADATEFPVWGDHVIYQTNGIPAQVSPLASGSLLNYADGQFGDFTVFDVPLSTATDISWHVVWTDRLGPRNGVDVEVYDTEERSCSDWIPAPYELNVICIDPVGGDWCEADDNLLPPNVVVEDICVPNGSTRAQYGFIQYQYPELIDRGSNTAETAGVFFSIIDRTIGAGATNNFVTETALARYRGAFKSR